MKRIVLVLSCLTLMVAMPAAAATQRVTTRGYVCEFGNASVMLVVDGYGNSATYCWDVHDTVHWNHDQNDRTHRKLAKWRTACAWTLPNLATITANFADEDKHPDIRVRVVERYRGLAYDGCNQVRDYFKWG